MSSGVAIESTPFLCFHLSFLQTLKLTTTLDLTLFMWQEYFSSHPEFAPMQKSAQEEQRSLETAVRLREKDIEEQTRKIDTLRGRNEELKVLCGHVLFVMFHLEFDEMEERRTPLRICFVRFRAEFFWKIPVCPHIKAAFAVYLPSLEVHVPFDALWDHNEVLKVWIHDID